MSEVPLQGGLDVLHIHLPRERLVIGLMTSDRKLKASREGSECRVPRRSERGGGGELGVSRQNRHRLMLPHLGCLLTRSIFTGIAVWGSPRGRRFRSARILGVTRPKWFHIKP